MENNPKNLKFSDQLVKAFEEHTNNVTHFNNVEEARFFIYKIWPDVLADKRLSQDQPDIYKRLEKIYKINLILAVGILPEKELISLFEAGIALYFLEMIDYIDLWEKIRAKLVTLEHADRDVLKEKLRNAILRNKGKITDNKIERNNQEFEPTIKQWLLDYTSVVGTGKAEAVKINEYFSANKNYQRLNESEKKRIRELVNFYESLKLSSLTAEGLEEKVMFSDDNNDTLILSNGLLQTYDQKVKDLIKKFKAAGLITEEESEIMGGDESVIKLSQGEEAGMVTGLQLEKGEQSLPIEQEVLAAYQGDLKRNKLVAKELENLNKKFSGDNKSLRQEFFKAVQKKNANQTIAILRLLTQNQDLENFIKDDPKLNKFLAAIWEKRYGQDFVAEFSKDPAQLKFIRLFLRYVLEERLGLSTNDAARIGLQLGNIFVSLGKKGYNKMAYFDVGSKEFHWFD